MGSILLLLLFRRKKKMRQKYLKNETPNSDKKKHIDTSKFHILEAIIIYREIKSIILQSTIMHIRSNPEFTVLQKH